MVFLETGIDPVYAHEPQVYGAQMSIHLIRINRSQLMFDAIFYRFSR